MLTPVMEDPNVAVAAAVDAGRRRTSLQLNSEESSSSNTSSSKKAPFRQYVCPGETAAAQDTSGEEYRPYRSGLLHPAYPQYSGAVSMNSSSSDSSNKEQCQQYSPAGALKTRRSQGAPVSSTPSHTRNVNNSFLEPPSTTTSSSTSAFSLASASQIPPSIPHYQHYQHSNNSDYNRRQHYPHQSQQLQLQPQIQQPYANNLAAPGYFLHPNYYHYYYYAAAVTIPRTFMSSPTSTSSMSSRPSYSWQQQLHEYCRQTHKRAPVYSIVSDRRGGRTAWSATTSVDGKHFSARYWYDGQYIENAKDDASEVALQQLRAIDSSPPTPTASSRSSRNVYANQYAHHHHAGYASYR